MASFHSMVSGAFVSLLVTGWCRAESQAPIVISAGRTEAYSIDTPASITVVGGADIEPGAARSLADLLPARAGLHVRDPYGDGSIAVIDMRGFGPTAGSNTLVLVDGRRLNNSSDIAPPDLGAIDLEDVDRIEIVQGSAGTLFGNQAVGGVVNVITRPPRKGALSATIGLGSYNGYELKARGSDRLESGLALRVSAGKNQTDNYRDQNAADRSDLGLKLELPYSPGRAFFEQTYRQDDLQLPGALFREELEADRRQSASAYQGDYSDVRTWVSRAGLRHALSDAWSLEAEATYRDNDRRFQTSFRSFPGSNSTQTRRVWGLNPRLAGQLGTGDRDLRLSLGADLEATDYSLHTAFGPQTTDQRIHALYAQATSTPAPGWNLTLGLRHAGVANDIVNADQRLEPDDQVTVGSAGLTYDPTAALRLFLRWDQNYRFAKVDELTNTVSGQPADLDTQTGDTYELGARLRQGPLELRAQVYRLELNNEISFDSSTFFNVNLPATRRNGATLELDWELDRDWRLAGSYGFVDSQVTAGPFAGNDLPLVPRHSARLSLDYTAATGIGAYAEGVFVGEQTLGGDFANAFPRLDAYTLVNLAARFRVGRWRLSARLNNLLDTRYSATGAVGFDADFRLRDAYFPSPERNFWLTARYEFGD